MSVTGSFVVTYVRSLEIGPKNSQTPWTPPSPREEVLVQTGNVVAVRDVSFDVREGETFVIMGLSGSGKSSLIRCLSRLIEPTRGQILIDGEDVLAMNKHQLRGIRRYKMGMVFQHFGNLPHKRVMENVVYGLQIQGMDKVTRTKRAAKSNRTGGADGMGGALPPQVERWHAPARRAGPGPRRRPRDPSLR